MGWLLIGFRVGIRVRVRVDCRFARELCDLRSTTRYAVRTARPGQVLVPSALSAWG